MKKTVFVAALVATASAEAQAPSLHPFSVVSRGPAPGRANYYGVEGARIEGDLEPAVGVASDSAVRPLSVVACPLGDAACTAREAFDPVRGLSIFHVWASFAFGHRAQLALDLPMGMVNGEAYNYVAGGTEYVLSGGARFGMGDPRMSSRIHLFGGDDDAIQIAASVEATLPLAHAQGRTGDARRFIGDDHPAGGANVIAEWIHDRMRLAGNLGGYFRHPRSVFDVSTRSALAYRVAFAYDVHPRVTVLGELDGQADFDSGLDGNPLELRAAAKYTWPEMQATAGLGTGLVRGAGSPLIRVFLQFAWLPNERESDDDHDGLLHRDDRCPDHAEDLDGFQDDDGCPDEDNDGDGIPDSRDLCVDGAEDHDGHADEDGCHDHDTDGDRIEDGYDGCPRVAEDMDGDRDNDGCPE